MEEKKKKYLFREQIGSIEGVVWPNESKFGKPWKAFKITRGYKDKDGQWCNAESFRHHDLPCVLEVLLRTMNWFRTQAEADVQDPVPMHAMDEGTKAKASSVGRKKRRSK